MPSTRARLAKYFEWLKSFALFSLFGANGELFEARDKDWKGRQAERCYWTAYRRSGSVNPKVFGTTESLSVAHLEEVATQIENLIKQTCRSLKFPKTAKR